MIITSGMIFKKELQIDFESLLLIYDTVTREGKNFRIIGLNGDVVFLTPDQDAKEEVKIEVEQLT